MRTYPSLNRTPTFLAALLCLALAGCSGEDGDPRGGGGVSGTGGNGGSAGDGGSAGTAVIVSDDFNAGMLNSDVWQVFNPRGDGTVEVAGVGTQDAHLLLSFPAGTSHDAWATNTSLRVMQSAPDEDFEIEVKFESEPTERFQSQGLLVEENGENYVRFDVSSDGFDLLVFGATFAAGEYTERVYEPITAAPITYLRLTRSGDEWTGRYSYDGEDWTVATTFTRALAVSSVGVFAGNFDPNPASMVVVDYFFETSSPIEPEDTPLCPPGEQFTLTTDSMGPGTVLRDPDKATYSCEEVVTLTAEPGPGAAFLGWSGALAGTTNPATLIVAANSTVTATFQDDDPGGGGGFSGTGGNGGSAGDGGSAGTAVIVSDDFDAGMLNSDVWQVFNPRGDGTVEVAGVGTQDAHLLLSFPAGTSHDAWATNTSLRVMQSAPDEDFEIEVKFESEPTERFQSQGLLVEENGENYVRFDVSSDGFDLLVFGATFAAGEYTERVYEPITAAPITYLRLTRSGDEWTGRYSYDGEDWTVATTFTRALAVSSVGVFAGNFDPNPASMVVVDYFFETSSPIEPEDTPLCPPGEQFTLTTDSMGPGTVLRDPDKATYSCEEVVTLTAEPGPGAAFLGWSGALAGTTNPATLIVAANSTVTATFALDQSPPQVSNVNATAGQTSASVSWETDELTTGVVEYGETTAYELGSVASSTAATSHGVTLPGLSEGTTYHYRVTAEDTVGNSATTGDATFTAATSGDSDSPDIDVWYGQSQTFGAAGVPQRFINVLGNVYDPPGLSAFTYALNGGPEQSLSTGLNGNRLAYWGDFNVEIDFNDLAPGLNVVTIRAYYASGGVSVDSVVVDHVDGVVVPPTYSIDWSTVSAVSEVAQIVDGKWSLSSDGMRVVEPGYDRLIAIGDIGWTDYEAIAEFTVNAPVDPNLAPVFGLAMRWTGHWDWDGQQPNLGWYPLGALIAFDWHQGIYTGLATWESDGNLVFGPGATPVPVIGEKQFFKMRCETLPNGDVLYSGKMWPASQPEPAGWTITYTSNESPATGSLLVVAHEIDVTLGNVAVIPVDN